MNGIVQRFHGNGALLQSRKIEEVGDRAETEHEMIEFQLVIVTLPFETVRHDDELSIEVDRFDVAIEKANALEHLAHRIHDVRDVEIARGHFVQHGREQKEILFIHERHFDVRIAGQGLIEMQRSIESAKAAAENDDLGSLVVSHGNAVGLRFDCNRSQGDLCRGRNIPNG